MNMPPKTGKFADYTNLPQYNLVLIEINGGKIEKKHDTKKWIQFIFNDPMKSYQSFQLPKFKIRIIQAQHRMAMVGVVDYS